MPTVHTDPSKTPFWMSMLARRGAEAWWEISVNMRASYLWFRPAVGGNWGDVVVASETPEGEGWELGLSGPLPRNCTKDQITQQIYDAMRKLPILGEGNPPSISL